MKEDIEKVAELLFQRCCFDPIYMDEEFIRNRCRAALESLNEEEYKQVCEKLKHEEI